MFYSVVSVSNATDCGEEKVTTGSVNIDNKGTEENAAQVFKFFREHLGATPEGAAGPMGCMDFESGGFNPAIENPSSGAYGLAQWLGSRKDALKAFADEKGKDMSNLGVQLEFLKKELENPYYAKAKAALKLTDVHEAQHQWLLWFEGLSQDSSQWHSEERNKRADKWFAKFGVNDPASASVLETGADSDSGTLECYSPTSGDSGDIVETAKGLKGYFTYSQDFRTTFGDPQNPDRNGQADCSSFVWLVLTKAGYKSSPTAWATPTMTADARNNKKWLEEVPEAEAKAGDVLVVNQGAGTGNDGHTAILLEAWHGFDTKIIEMGGGSSGAVHESTVQYSFGSLLSGDICLARAIKK